METEAFHVGGHAPERVASLHHAGGEVAGQVA